jgi:hypothetical protein
MQIQNLEHANQVHDVFQEYLMFINMPPKEIEEISCL